LGLFNAFADGETEEAYLVFERNARRKQLRAMLVILIGSLVVFALANPIFFPADVIASYNVFSALLIIGLIATYVWLGTDFYLSQRWIDPWGYFALTALSALLIGALERPDAAIGTSFHVLALITIGLTFVFSSIGFVANTRWAFFAMVTLMVVFAVFLSFQPLPFFPLFYMAANASFFLVFGLFANWSLDARAREAFAANREAEAARERTEDLLFNVLPQSVANRLKSGEAVADSFSDLTVIFADIVGFSKLAKQLSPGHLVKILNRFFSLADQVADRYGIEKVKTIGDAYLAVSGGTASADCGAGEAVAFGRDLIALMDDLAAEYDIPIELRVGIHTGPVVGGVVGSSRLAYDYWGDTMNIASRIEGAATAGGVAVSSSTYLQCTDRSGFGLAEKVLLKGVGEVEIYRLSAH